MIGGHAIAWRAVISNAFGFASADLRPAVGLLRLAPGGAPEAPTARGPTPVRT